MRMFAVLVSNRPVPLIPLSLCLSQTGSDRSLDISVLSSVLSFVVSDSHKHNKLLASVGGQWVGSLTDRPGMVGWCSQLKVLS